MRPFLHSRIHTRARLTIFLRANALPAAVRPHLFFVRSEFPVSSLRSLQLLSFLSLTLPVDSSTRRAPLFSLRRLFVFPFNSGPFLKLAHPSWPPPISQLLSFPLPLTFLPKLATASLPFLHRRLVSHVQGPPRSKRLTLWRAAAFAPVVAQALLPVLLGSSRLVAPRLQFILSLEGLALLAPSCEGSFEGAGILGFLSRWPGDGFFFWRVELD